MQVLFTGVLRAPGEDAIERTEGAEQLCSLKFSSASYRGNSGSTSALYQLNPDLYLEEGSTHCTSVRLLFPETLSPWHFDNGFQ